MPFIRESVVTTLNDDGTAHVAPLGVIEDGALLVLAPFAPSRTLDNLRRQRAACVNYVVDARVFAGCVTGRRTDWPVLPAMAIPGLRLEAALAHSEVEVADVEEDEQRPRFSCREVREAVHGPFRGLNRAQAAVLEAAILVSRLHLLPPEKIEREMGYLRIAVEKTAGEAEREAWAWCVDAVEAHRLDARGAPLPDLA